jgi:hypothetical protein
VQLAALPEHTKSYTNINIRHRTVKNRLRRMLSCPLKRKHLNENNCLGVHLSKRVRELFEDDLESLYFLPSKSEPDSNERGEFYLSGIELLWCLYEVREPNLVFAEYHILVCTKSEDDEYGLLDTHLQIIEMKQDALDLGD